MNAARTTQRRPSGICINKKPLAEGKACTKMQSGEVQTPVGDFVCAECSARLFAKKSGMPPIAMQAAAGVAALAVMGGGGWFAYDAFFSGPSKVCVSPAPGGNEERIRAFAGDAAAALVAAGECRTIGNAADAAALLRNFAERDANAALVLGQIHDPSEVSPGRVGQLAPGNAAIAAENYLRAKRAGHPEATANIARLEAWAERAAADGNAVARSALLLIRSTQ